MAFFDQMKDIFSSVKEKGAEVAASLKEKGVEVAAAAADKTKDAARIAKLTVDLGTEKDNLKKAYLELGKACYEEYKDNADGLFAQLCGEITVAAARVEETQAELDTLKGGFRSQSQPDFESVVAEQEADIDLKSDAEDAGGSGADDAGDTGDDTDAGDSGADASGDDTDTGDIGDDTDAGDGSGEGKE